MAVKRAQPPAANLHLPLQDNVDYVAGFQELARLGLEMHRHGPTVPLLIRKAVLELRVGSYNEACSAAADALLCDVKCSEAYWLQALGMLGRCLTDLGLLTEGPGELRHRPSVAPLEQLEMVRQSLVHCLQFGSGQDDEAAALLAYIQAVLASRPARGRLQEMMRCLA